MADDLDYGALLRQHEAQQASGAVAATYNVTPEQAATAIQYGPQAGLAPGAAMYQAGEAKEQAQQAEQGAVVARSPAVAGWVNNTDPAHVAAAKDDLTSLERIHMTAGQYWGSGGPAGDFARAEGAAAQQAILGREQLHNAKDIGEWFTGLGNRVFGELGADFGAPWAAIGNPVGQALHPALTAARQWEEAHGLNLGNPLMQRPQTQEQWAQESLGAGNVLTNLIPLHFLPKGRVVAAAGEAGEAGEAAPAFVPPHQPTPSGGWATNDTGVVLDAQGQPVHFPDEKTAGVWAVRANRAAAEAGIPNRYELGPNGPGGTRFVQEMDVPTAEPGRGGSPAYDAARAVDAEADAAAATATQQTMADSTVFGRSPSTVEDFLSRTVPDRTVSIEPQTLVELAAEGHTPFPDIGPQLARAIALGEPVEVPYSQFQTAVAGQPFADKLTNAATFREGGVSMDDAKEAAKAQPVSDEELENTTGKGVQPAPMEAPADLNEDETTRFKTIAAAVEHELDVVQREQYLSPMPIQKANAVGLSEGELSTYGDEMRAASEDARARAADKLAAQIRRERKPDWQEAMARHTETATKELQGLNHIAAYKLLSEDKLDRDLVHVSYPELAARVPNTLTQVKGVIPSDSVAETLGYHSMRDVLNDMAFLHQAIKDSKAANIDTYVAKRAKQIAQQRTGQELGEDFYSPEAIRQLALESIPEDKALGTLEHDLRLLAEANGGSFNLADLKARAEQLLLEQEMGKVLNTRRLNERIYKLGRAAEQAVNKGRFGAAWGFQQARFMRYVQLKPAYRLQKDAAKAVKQWQRLARKRTLPNMDQDALNIIHAVQAQMGMPVSALPADLEGTLQQYGGLDSYVSARNNAGAEIVGTNIPTRLPDETFTKYMARQTVGDFYAIRDMLTAIAEDGVKQRQVVRQGKVEDREAVIQQVLDKLDKFTHVIDKEPTDFVGVADATRRGLDAWLVRPESLLIHLGGRTNNPLLDLYDQVMAAKHFEDAKMLALSEHFHANVDRIGKDFDKWLKQKLPLNAFEGTGFQTPADPLGNAVFLSNKDITMAALHMGDVDAIDKFARGYNTQVAAVEAIVHRYATDAMWNYVETMRDAFKMLQPDVQRIFLERNGVHLKLAETRDVTVPSGSPATTGRTIKGGYFPIMYDWNLMPEKFRQILEPGGMLGAKEYRSWLPSNNYTKQRTGFAAPVSMNLGMIIPRIKQVVHDLAFRDALVNFNKVVSDQRVQNAISRAYGPEYAAELNNYIRDVAGAQSTGMGSMGWLSRAIDYMSNAQQVSLIGFNYRTVLKHGLTAAAITAREIGPAYFAEASRQIAQGGLSFLQQLDAESPELAHRMINIDQKARDSLQKLTTGRDKITDQIERASYMPVALSDKFSAYLAYLGGKLREVDRQMEAGEPLDMDKAQREGERTLRVAHGATGVANDPAIFREASKQGWVHRLLGAQTRFQRFLNVNYNVLRTIGPDLGFGQDETDPSAAASKILVNLLLAAGVSAAVAGELWSAKKGWTIASGMAKGLSHVSFGSLPVVGNWEQNVAWMAGGQKGLPPGGMMETAMWMYGRVIYDWVQVASPHPRKNSPADRRGRVERAVRDTSNAALTSYKLPGGAVAQMQHAFETFLDPKANPQPKRNR